MKTIYIMRLLEMRYFYKFNFVRRKPIGKIKKLIHIIL